MKSRGIDVALVVSTVLLSVVRVSAQEIKRAGDEIVVTARGFSQAESKTPGSVGVITGDELSSRAPVSVTDAFKLVPGLARSSDGVWGGDAVIRGLSRDSVVMNIDGCRVNTATDIGARFGLVNPLEIERVEILKGPISPLYGSGSLGGVVNIVTKGSEKTDFQGWRVGLSGLYGSNPDGLNGFGHASYSEGGTFVSASQSYRSHESYKDGDGVEVLNSQYEDYGTRLRGRFVVDENNLDVNFQYYEGRDIGIPGSGTAPLPAAADVTYESVVRRMVSISDDLGSPGNTWRNSKIMVFMQDIERNVRIDNYAASSPLLSTYPSAKHETRGGRWINLFGTGQNMVTAGADVWRRSLKDSKRIKNMKSGEAVVDQPLPETDFISSGAFLQDDFTGWRTFTISAGGRADQIKVSNEANPTWDAYENTESSAGANLGATWKATDKFNVKLVGANGYRSASIEERYQYLELGGGMVKYGNPDLKPEKSRFVECGMNWFGDVVHWSLTGFMNDLTDLIGEEKVDDSTIRNQNISKAKIQGAEAELRWLIGGQFHVFVNGAWIDGKNSDTKEYLLGIQPVTIVGGIQYGDQKDGLWVQADAQHSMKQDKTPVGVDEAPAWTTVDLRAGWVFIEKGKMHTVFAGIENVLDEAYRNYLTTYRGNFFNEPGRSISAGYSVTF